MNKLIDLACKNLFYLHIKIYLYFTTVNCMINKTSALAAHGWQSMNSLYTSTPLYSKITHLHTYLLTMVEQRDCDGYNITDYVFRIIGCHFYHREQRTPVQCYHIT